MKNRIIWDLIHKIIKNVYEIAFLEFVFIYKIEVQCTNDLCTVLNDNKYENETKEYSYACFPFMYFKTQKNNFYVLCAADSSILEYIQKNADLYSKSIKLEFTTFNEILKNNEIKEMGLIFRYREDLPMGSPFLVRFFIICGQYSIKPFILTNFYSTVSICKIAYISYSNENYEKNVQNFIEYSLLEEKGLVDPEFPIDTKSFDFFMNHINGWNDLDIDGFWRGAYQDIFCQVKKDKMLFGVIALDSLSLEEQARFIYDFWYMQLPLVEDLGVGVAHWKKDELVFVIESKGDAAFLKTYIGFVIKKIIKWDDTCYSSIYACIKSARFCYTQDNSSFNKYYLGVFDDSIARRSCLESIKYSFDNYYTKIKNAYDFNEEIKVEDYREVSDADPDIYYKFPKACYKYLGCKGLSETLWISEPVELFELVVEEVVEMRDKK